MLNPIPQSKSFKRALLAGALLLTSAGMSFADYNAGSSAFNGGNYVRAYQEFKQSADAGNSLAQFMMGRLYAEGRGVVMDNTAAYMWYDLSASNGNSRAIAARDSIAAQLDADELDRAQTLAAEWRANRPGNSSVPVAAPTAPAYTPTSQPYSLRNVQAALYNLGYAVGTPDGVIGPKSRAAIRAYQVDSGLPVSGEPSIALYEKLQASLAQRSGSQAKPAPQTASAVGSATISEAQTELRQRGYAITAITGTANAETAAAVRAYQADARLPITGDITSDLMQQLRTAKADSGAIYRAQVKQVQAALNATGYSAGPADGALGPKSRAAISRYQSDNSLAATGEVNGELLASLGIGSESQTPANVVSAATIRATKEELQAHGYSSGDLNGTMDSAMSAAIRTYQSDAGLEVTGEASDALLEHLRRSNTRSNVNADTQVALNIEDQLQRRGYVVGPVDGVIDTRTRQAIRAYQADVGLSVTGEADDRLLAHLQASDVKPLTSNAIAETQWLLNRLGYLKGEGGGIMGAKSTAAIRSYQGDRGFTVTGQPSMELLAKLRAEPIREPGADSF
jgi:peptidoglycan hydrolase-like protein with peptidoglycan-binding domain